MFGIGQIDVVLGIQQQRGIENTFRVGTEMILADLDRRMFSHADAIEFFKQSRAISDQFGGILVQRTAERSGIGQLYDVRIPAEEIQIEIHDVRRIRRLPHLITAHDDRVKSVFIQLMGQERRVVYSGDLDVPVHEIHKVEFHTLVDSLLQHGVEKQSVQGNIPPFHHPLLDPLLDTLPVQPAKTYRQRLMTHPDQNLLKRPVLNNSAVVDAQRLCHDADFHEFRMGCEDSPDELLSKNFFGKRGTLLSEHLAAEISDCFFVLHGAIDIYPHDHLQGLAFVVTIGENLENHRAG